MHYRLIANFLGITLAFTGLFMLSAAFVSFLFAEREAAQILLAGMITLAVALGVYALTRGKRQEEIRHRDAFLIVTLTWSVMSLFSTLPYLLTGTFVSFTDAYFESMSGFSTTGASVMTDIEIVSRGVLFWRALTHWIGGMGIIVLALAVLPMLGGGGMQLFKAEVPELSVDRLQPRILDTAKSLWFIYVGLTAANVLLYCIGGMDLFDAVCHAFATLATGGFSTKNASIGHYQSAFIDYVAVIFMFLAGVNFSLYFLVLKKQPLKIFRNAEFRFYAGVVLLATVFLCWTIWAAGLYRGSDAFRFAAFQAVSIVTTTGFATADYEKWPVFAQMILMTLMFFGGMIGSTGGGIKQVRMLIILKQGYRELFQLIHPRAVISLKLDEKFLTKELLGSIWGFFFLFLLVIAVATLAMTMVGVDLVTAVSTVISAICNVGPALGEAGPAENYAGLPVAAKWILSFCMLTGRLEVYTVLILFVPAFWRR